MKRICLSVAVSILTALFVFMVAAWAQQPLDTTGAKEGEIRGSAGIGMGGGGNNYVVVLPINMTWLDTGIDVKTGDTLRVTAAPSKNHPPCDGRTGCPPYREPGDVIAGGALGWTLAVLVGRIGEAGTPFSIGESYENAVDRDGRLFIGFNDCPECYGNNTGAFEVTITLIKK